jgi:hypothetical protein
MAEARAKLPLRRLMEEHGDAMEHKDVCPICKKKGASLKELKGRQFFRCFHSTCPSQTSENKRAWDEVAYLSYKLGLNRKDAFVAYLKEAKVWREVRHAPSILPGQRKRRTELPEEQKQTESLESAGGSTEPLPGSGETTSQPLPGSEGSDSETASHTSDTSDEGLFQKCLEVIRSEGKASIALFQRRLRLRFSRASSLMDELEKRGIVGPAKGSAPREILSDALSGGAGPPIPPGVEPPDDDDDGQSRPKRWLQALRDFYAQLVLTEEDGELIWKKRGLSRTASEAFGFKSSQPSNIGILQAMAGKYSEDELVTAGLWRRDENGCRPEPQLCGYGNTGQKNDKGELVWGPNVHPVLIPYLDMAGEVISIRPHKGNIPGQRPMVYVARFVKGWQAPPGFAARDYRPQHCVVAEGEFKGCALYWVFEGRIGVAALPGISQAKNYFVIGGLKEWLRWHCAAERIVVAFDNQEKGDPRLPGFKPDKRKRFDADIWARYLGTILEQQFCATRICRLPDEWRDENGKADWDGQAARFMQSHASDRDSDAVWREHKVELREIFFKALASAVLTSELKHGKLFAAEEERIIQNGLDRLFYSPRLPNGGEKEQGLARKLVKLANGTLKDEPGLGVQILAEQYRETRGWYYILKPLSDSVAAKWTNRRQAEQQKSQDDRNQDLIWFCDLRLKGIPTLVANFRMDCFFDLVRADGMRDLFVEITTNQGERSERLRLDAESFSTPSGRTGFRVWLRNHSKGIWRGGERELEDLGLDAMHEVAHLDVHEITALGYDAASGIWFFGDCAYAQSGTAEKWVELLADEDGVYWHEGQGYLLAKTGSGGQTFRQGLPLMHPSEVLQFDESEQKDKTGDERWEAKFFLVSRKEAKEPDDKAVNRLLAELALRLTYALGGMDAFFLLGAFLSFVGAPEFKKRERCFPLLFLHGETRQGKTTTLRWLMELFGFHRMPSGIGASRNSTAVGLQIALEQYSDIPVWLTDWDSGVSGEKQQIVHDSFDEALSSKWSPDGTVRRVRTRFVIDGESRPGKTSTRYRFAQVLISKANRRGPSQVPWFERNRGFFFSIVRSLLRRQEEFSRMMLEHYDVIAKDLAGVESRAVQVHGAAYGGFVAAAQMLGKLIPAQQLAEFRQFLKNKCTETSEENERAVQVNRWWMDFISIFQRGIFGNTKEELERYFKVKTIEMDHPPGATNKDEHGNYIQGRWKRRILFIQMTAVWSLMEKELRQMGKSMAMEITDFREQISRRECWSEKNNPKSGQLKQRFAGKSLSCWAFEVDKVPVVGYQQQPDEIVEAAKNAKDDPGELIGHFNDPRKGDIYALIDMLEGDSQ